MKEKPPLTDISADEVALMDCPNPMFDMHDDGGVTLRWGGYDYYVAAHRIDTPVKLLGWLRQIGEKEWEDATAQRVAYLIEVLAGYYEWAIYGV